MNSSDFFLMKCPPNYIIFKQSLRYLSDDEQQQLRAKMRDYVVIRKSFLTNLLKHFDIELFRTSPLIWQDIWLYNYIKYDSSEKLPRSGLIAKYEREVFVEDDVEFAKKKNELNEKAPVVKLKKLK